MRKFFVRADGGYRIKKQLREICIFSRQDFTKDPPFSRMDLVSCRNVLIYFGNSLQEKVLPVLHYALRPGGFLLLCSAEGIGQFDHLFAKADKKHRIFVKKNISTTPAHRNWPGRYILDALHKEPTPEKKKAGRAEQGPEHNLQQEVGRMLLRRLEPATPFRHRLPEGAPLMPHGQAADGKEPGRGMDALASPPRSATLTSNA